MTISACSAAFGSAVMPAAGAERLSDCGLVADFELALISKTATNMGRVRVTGIVRNRGTVVWQAAGPAHHLQMVLAQSNSPAQPDGEPVQPLVPIRHVAVGQSYRIDHQINWVAGQELSYPRYVVRFSEIGAARVLSCRSDRSRKELLPAEIDRLFLAAEPEVPLAIKSYRFLGGVGVNTLEAQLVYRRKSALAGRITASVAAPYTATSNPVMINGSDGRAAVRVHIPCDARNRAVPARITYRLWGSLSLPGGSGWVPSFSLDHSIPYNELCGSGAFVHTQP